MCMCVCVLAFGIGRHGFHSNRMRLGEDTKHHCCPRHHTRKCIYKGPRSVSSQQRYLSHRRGTGTQCALEGGCSSCEVVAPITQVSTQWASGFPLFSQVRSACKIQAASLNLNLNCEANHLSGVSIFQVCVGGHSYTKHQSFTCAHAEARGPPRS